MGPKFYPEAHPGDAGKQTTFHKIQEMVPLQDKIKEDERIRIKDSNKDKVNHQSTLIENQS